MEDEKGVIINYRCLCCGKFIGRTALKYCHDCSVGQTKLNKWGALRVIDSRNWR
jgi:hypothetical protein